MDIAEQFSMEDLLQERSLQLPPLIDAIKTETTSLEVLRHVELSLKYVPTYSVDDINEGLFQYIMPSIEKNLQKVFDENTMIADSADEDLVLNIVKNNYEISQGFICVLRVILDNTLHYKDIELSKIRSVPLHLANCLVSTFRHCGEGSDAIKDKLNSEISNLFLGAQELHTCFLKLLDLLTSVEDESCLMNKVLESMCHMSELLFRLHIKSMVDNWKTFACITEKHFKALCTSINLQLPFQYLIPEISKNLSSLEDADAKLVTQVVKITGFLTKVVLKLCDIFWESLEDITSNIVKFCCILYSCPLRYFKAREFPTELINVINTTLFKPAENLIYRLSTCDIIIKIIEECDSESSECYPYGFLNFIDIFSKSVILNNQESDSPVYINLRIIFKTIFSCVNKCKKEFFWNDDHDNILFNLAVDLSALVLLYEKYSDIEMLLLENMLQANIWGVMLSMDTWCLILSCCDTRLSVEALNVVLSFIESCNIGIFTIRPELIYLKHFVFIIYQSLPTSLRNEILKDCNICDNTKIGQFLKLSNIPPQQLHQVENLVSKTYLLVQGFKEEDGASIQDIISTGENLELLATANFEELGMKTERVVSLVCMLWDIEFTNEIFDNNIFQYFIFKLCHVTATLIQHFDTKQLIMILNQLNLLSNNEVYRISVCYLLFEFANSSFRFMFEFDGQTKYQILSQVCNVIVNLLQTNNSISKQCALDLLKQFTVNSQYEFVVKNTLKNCSSEENKFICNYLQGNSEINTINYEYFKLLATNANFQHSCIKWSRTGVMQQPCKKFKQDLYNHSDIIKEHNLSEFSDNTRKLETTVRTEKTSRREPRQPLQINTNNEANTNVKHEEEDNASEVIQRLKGEVKCLANVLKTEKLTRKNVTDLKILTQQILSYL